MTKSQWTELIIRFLTSETTPEQLRKYHPLEVEKIIEQIYNDIVYNICLTAMTYRDMGQLDNLTKAYIVPVLHDKIRNERYFNLPTPIIPLPRNKAIRMISAVQDQSDYYYYVENNQFKTLKKMDIFLVSDRAKYYVEGNKIFLVKKNETDFPTELLTKLVIPFSSFDDDEEIPMIGGKDSMLYQGVIKLLVGKPQEDLSNDNYSK